MSSKTQTLIDLPEDLLIQILRTILWISGVERILMTERVCKALKRICDSHVVWVSALDILGFNSAPMITARNVLLGLSSAELRREVIQALRLQKNWLSSYGPSVTNELSILLNNSNVDRVLVRGVPEVNVVFTLLKTGTLDCWCLNAQALVWVFPLQCILNCSVTPSRYTAFDYELVGKGPLLRIAMCVESEKGHTAFVMLYDTKARNAALMHKFRVKEQGISAENQPTDIYIRGQFVVLDITLRGTGRVFVVSNWKTRETFKIIPSSKYILRRNCAALTSERLFLCPLVMITDPFCELWIVSVRFDEISGVQSERYEDWNTYSLDDLISARKGHKHSTRFDSCMTDSHLYTISASQSGWLERPSTRIMIAEHDNCGLGSMYFDCTAFDYVWDKEKGWESVTEVSATLSLSQFPNYLSPSVPTSGRALITTSMDHLNEWDDVDKARFRIGLLALGPEEDGAVIPLKNIDSRWISACTSGNISMDSHGAMLVSLLGDEINIKRFD